MRCEPLVMAMPGVVMEVTLLAENFETPSTQTFMYWAVPPLLNVALMTTGEFTVEPLDGAVMVTTGLPGGGALLPTLKLRLCEPLAPLLSQARTTSVYAPGARLTCALNVFPAPPLATLMLLA